VEPVSGALAGAGLAYAARGWPVLPIHWPEEDGCSCRDPACPSPGKHPLTRHGLHDAADDPEVIRAWLRRWPAANVAVRTGVAFDAADLDDAGRLDPAVLAELMDDGPMVLTGSGGAHLHYAPTGLGNRARLLPGLDWRGQNGYVVMPPSLHLSGQRYRWAVPPGPLPEVGPLLMAALRPALPSPRPAWPRPVAGNGARAALEGACRVVAEATVGCRNARLNWAAYRMRERIVTGELAVVEVVSALVDAGLAAGLGPREVEQTVRSGLAATGCASGRQA
jgi:bifunctional DNA primase/polymerase-like protein